MPDTGTFVLLGGQASVKAASLFTAELARASSSKISLWQGISESSSFLWLVSDPAPELDEVSARAADHGITINQTHIVFELQRWEAPFGSEIAVANFVIRVVKRDSVDELLPQIINQMEKVWQQPNCLKCSLFQIPGQRSHLLGVTYWATYEGFEEYKTWAFAHPWREVISPDTLDVPLRMLTRQINWSSPA